MSQIHGWVKQLLDQAEATLAATASQPSPASLEEARRLVSSYVDRYNHARLHSALGYITPADKLNGLDQVIFAERDRKLEAARQRRQQARQAMRAVA